VKAKVDGQTGKPENKPSFSKITKSCIDSKKAEWRSEKHGAHWYATIAQYAYPLIG